jgi:hypothetical protein
MRWLVNITVGLMVVAIAGAALLHRRADAGREARLQAVQAELARFQKEITLQAAITGSTGTLRFPDTIDPTWFDGHPPRNHLLGSQHPWVEVAPMNQRQLQHPPDRVASSAGAASFWYNPHLGVVRARVPMGESDQDALTDYNYINGTTLGDLYASSGSSS